MKFSVKSGFSLFCKTKTTSEIYASLVSLFFSQKKISNRSLPLQITGERKIYKVTTSFISR